MKDARLDCEAKPNDMNLAMRTLYPSEYVVSKYVRSDNTVNSVECLGYLNARILYPDLKPLAFATYIQEVASGKGTRPYANLLAKA
jgi:hypothetical protein